MPPYFQEAFIYYENKHIDVIAYICLYASSQIRTGDGMSKVIQTLTAIAGNKSGSPLLDAFERENLIAYPIDPTIEPEIKMLWSTRIKTTKNQLKKIFNCYSNATTHDKSQDHFVYIPLTIEANNYDLTSFAVDTFKRNPKTGGPIPTMELTKTGYQARLRMAISLASREQQLLEQIKNYNSPDQLSKHPIQKLSPATCFGPPEFSIKTLWSDDDSVFRNEYEAKVGYAPDVLGIYLTQMKKDLPEELYKQLKDIRKDKEVSLGVTAVCMTRRLAYFIAHYVHEHDAYVLYECTLDRNKFCSPNNTYIRGQDLEQEFEAICVLPSRIDAHLSPEQQTEVLAKSLENFESHVTENIQGLKRSPGSKMERATSAVEQYYKRNRSRLPEYFKNAAERKDVAQFDGKYAIMEQVSPHEAMAYIGSGYEKLAKLFVEDHDDKEQFVDKNLFSSQAKPK
tara:strand:- start:17604 stop:18962 length:1359 start_codon:yes stop_codon:yes gene_type:complete